MDNTDPYKTKFKEERLYMSTNQNLMQHEDDHFPAINIYWDHDGGKASELLCFAEYNSERAEGAQICIGTYVSDEDETQYYAPYMAERNKEP